MVYQKSYKIFKLFIMQYFHIKLIREGIKFMQIINKIDNTTYTNITKGRTDKNGIVWIPDCVVCHITEGSYEGAISWLKNPKAKASAHFVVSRKGEITQLVDIRDTAWCNGTSYTPSNKEKATALMVKSRNTNANYYTVSIEHEGIYTKTEGALTTEQEEATVFLIKHISDEIKKLYGDKGNIGIVYDRNHIIGHYEISPSSKPNCPGNKFPFTNIIETLKEELEVITKTNILIDNKKYEVDRILKDGKNYVELRAFEKAGYKIGYRQDEKLPTFNK